MKQSYIQRRKRDIDGGGARSEGAGFWDPAEFSAQMLASDQDGDHKQSKTEVRGLILPHFDDFDANKDGLLDAKEIEEVARWLNIHHKPGVPAKPKK